MPQARDDEQPPTHDPKRPALALSARFAAGTVEVRRSGRQRFALRDAQQLRVGDRIVTAANQQLTLLLPGHQWIVLRGTLRLLSVPRRGTAPRKIHVALLRGQLRARATTPGGGITVHHGRRRRISAAHGEMRVALRGVSLVVSSVDATIDVAGPHARRTVAAGLGITLAERPGFAHALLAAPGGLRPGRHRGRTPPRLSWQPVARASGYRVVIGRDTDFFQVVARVTVQATSFAPRLSRAGTGKFYWKVMALGPAGNGAPSKIYAFELSDDND